VNHEVITVASGRSRQGRVGHGRVECAGLRPEALPVSL